MFAEVTTAALLGVDAYQVRAECHLENGLPAFTVVGLPDNAIKESRERISAAIKNSGYAFPKEESRSILLPLTSAKREADSICPSLSVFSAHQVKS